MNSKIMFDIIKNRKKLFFLSGIITIVGIITLTIFGLNTGVDFKAGTTLDIIIGKKVDRMHVEQLIKDTIGFKDSTTTVGGTNSDRATVRFDKILTSSDVENISTAFKKEFGDQVTHEENTVDTGLAKELAQRAIFAVLLASTGIIIYISIRFEWRFAIAAIIALLHDAFIVISFFSIFRWEVNLPFVAAILTIVGYSINDTIVIFDRIRENLRFAKTNNLQDLSELVNRNIWETMTRSINTILTVLVGALALFIFGSAAIRYFLLAMVIGLISGGYSSIFIASPIWLILKNKSVSAKKRQLVSRYE